MCSVLNTKLDQMLSVWSGAAPFLYSVNSSVGVPATALVTDPQVVITYQGNFWRENISLITHVWYKVTAFRALYMSLISSVYVCVCESSSWGVVCCPVRPGPGLVLCYMSQCCRDDVVQVGSMAKE